MKYLLPLFFLLLVVSLFSCGPDYIYEKSYDISEDGWAYEDTLNFEVDIVDTVGLYNLYLVLEHATDYRFQNLYTKIYTKFPSGERLEKEISLELAYKDGTWVGNCNSKVCNVKIPIQQRAFFNAEGQYIITLEQYMRQNPIEGINKVEFKVDNTGEQKE